MNFLFFFLPSIKNSKGVKRLNTKMQGIKTCLDLAQALPVHKMLPDLYFKVL